MKAPLFGLAIAASALAGGAYLMLGGRMPHAPALSGSRRRRGLRGHAESSELKLYIDNDGDLYRSQTTSIINNLKRRLAKGTYDRTLAEKLWGYLAESGAKKYVKDMGGGTWHQVFSVADRKAVAKELNDDFLAEYGR